MKILARANKKLRGNGKFYTIPEPTKSWFYVTEYDSDGYPIKAKTIGCSGAMPYDYMYGSNSSSSKNIMARFLKEFEINEGVTNIGKYAFCYCNGLVKIKIPNSVTSIGNYAFKYCNLTNITIPDGVTSIGNSAFQQTSLTNITIPNSVTSIGSYAFDSCYGLTSLTILATIPPTLDGGAFSNCSNLTTIYIPKGTLDAYSTATNWSYQASKFVELSE